MAAAGIGTKEIETVKTGGNFINKKWLIKHAYADSIHDKFKSGFNLDNSLPQMPDIDISRHISEDDMLHYIGIQSNDGFLTNIDGIDGSYNIIHSGLTDSSLNILCKALKETPPTTLKFVVDFAYTNMFNKILQKLITLPPPSKKLQYIYNLTTAFDSA